MCLPAAYTGLCLLNQSLAVAIDAFVSECAQNKQQLGISPGHVFHPPHGLYVHVLCRAVIKTTESKLQQLLKV